MTTATMAFVDASLDFTKGALKLTRGNNHIAFSRDGALEASSDIAMWVKVRRSGEVQLERDFNASNEKVRPTQRVRGTEFNSDGSLLFVAAADTLYALDTGNGRELWSYTPPRAWAFLIVSPLAITTAQGLVAAAFDNGAIGVWSDDGIPHSLWSSNDGPRMLSFVAGSDHLVGSDSFSLNVWSWQERRSLRKRRLNERVYGMATSSSLPVTATRTLHGVQLWDTASLESMASLPVHPGLPVMAFHPSRELIAVAEKHGVRVYGFDGSLASHHALEDVTVLSLAYHPGGNELSVGCSNGDILRISV